MGAEWILLRGLVRESLHWGLFTHALQRAFPGDRITALDLPGTGGRFCEKSPLTMAETVKKIRPRDGGGAKHLVAISLGAMAAIEWASQAPEEIASLTLINPSIAGLSAPYERLLPAAWPGIARAVVTRDAFDRESIILALTTTRTDGRRAETWRRALVQQHHPVSRVNFARQLVAAARFRLPSTKPAAPILLLSSAADGLVSPSCSEKLARAWKLEREVHTTGGHDLPFDDPEWIIARIRAVHGAP